MKYIEGEAS